jgi:hypothetical protein
MERNKKIHIKCNIVSKKGEEMPWKWQRRVLLYPHPPFLLVLCDMHNEKKSANIFFQVIIKQHFAIEKPVNQF